MGANPHDQRQYLWPLRRDDASSFWQSTMRLELPPPLVVTTRHQHLVEAHRWLAIVSNCLPCLYNCSTLFECELFCQPCCISKDIILSTSRLCASLIAPRWALEWVIYSYFDTRLFNRLGVAGAVLQSPPSVINWLTDSWFVEISS